MLKWLKSTGPGTIVTAAFIGPGTVTVCTLAGNNFGTSLLWVLLFAVISTIILQEMSARLGIVTGKGLGEALSQEIQNPIFKVLFAFLIVISIFVGNAAFEAGNITGANMGLELLTRSDFTNIHWLKWILGILAGIMLFYGSYRTLELFFISIVILMSAAFIITAFLTKPNLVSLFYGLTIPSFPEKSWLTIAGLLGTTIVPYNLFLHASLVSKKWNHTEDLPKARRDLLKAIVLGGLISISIVICGATVAHGTIQKVTDLPSGLEPVFGASANYFFGIGLFAAGFTSTITAPLAAALALCGFFGWNTDRKSTGFRLSWGTVLITGIIITSLGYKPIKVIQVAQFANGILLPVIAVLLIWVVNKQTLMGKYVNTKFHNIAGVVVLGICLLLGIKSIYGVIY